MNEKNANARHVSNRQTVAESAQEQCTVIAMAGNSSKVPSQKRKEEADKILYINRI